MNFYKKAQGEIITTVLIILLVLAAIVIVWQVVNTTVSKGSQEAEGAASCIGLQVEVVGTPTYTDSSDTFSVKIQRGADSSTGIDSMKVFVIDSAGTIVANNDSVIVPASFNQVTAVILNSSAIPKGSYTVKVAPKAGTRQCDVLTTKGFTV